MVKIGEKSIAEINYTGKLENGQIFDTTVGDSEAGIENRPPLKVQLGVNMLVPGFEKELIGLAVGEKKSFKVDCEDAYGQRSDKNLVEVSKEQIRGEIAVGQDLQTQVEGRPFVVTIAEIKEDVVVLDSNSKLAGHDLYFEVEVVSISDETEETKS